MLIRYILKRAIGPTVKFSLRNKTRHVHNVRFTQLLNSSHNLSSSSTSEIEDEDDTKFDYGHEYIISTTNSTDPVLNKIRKCKSIEKFKKLTDEVSSKDQIIQLLLLHGRIRDSNEPTILKNIDQLVCKVSNLLPQMNDVEIGICLLYLRLLSVNTRIEPIQNIIEILLNNIKKKGVDFDSQALALFTEFLYLERNLYAKLLMVETLPCINAKLDKCNDPVEAYFIGRTLNQIHAVLSKNALAKIKLKIEEFLLKKVISEEDPKTIFSYLNFLNFPHWSIFNSNLIQRLLLSLEKSIPQMTQKELIHLNRCMFLLYEPSNFIKLIRDRAEELMKKTQNVDLLQIICLYCTPDQRIKYVEMLRDKVMSHQTTLGPGSDSLPIFFKILRLLKISDIDLCDCFWTKTCNKVFSLREIDLKYKVPKYFYRYMSFNNNLGGTYRHYEFEKIITEYCIEEMKTGSSYIPKDFVKFASFVIAYNDYDSIPSFIIEKLIVQQEQFDIFDCKILSRSLEIFYGFRGKKGNFSKVLDDQIEILNYIIDNCTKKLIQDPNLHIRQMNIILSSHIRRRAKKDSQVFYDMMNWYNKPHLELNSRSIRELCHSLLSSKFAHDQLCDKFFDYIVDNSKIVSGETVSKVLTTSYTLSFFPENLEALDTCSQIIHRDFNIMNGLSIVQALLALTFYKQVPYELVMLVFQGDFIKRLEQEIQMAYKLDTYPQKVMTLVMQLNRAVCLDCPEFNIRWFQQNFIEAQMSKKPIYRTKFQDEVKQLLLHIVPSRNHLAINRITPYGYNIDFEIHVDNFQKFLPLNPSVYANSNFKPKKTKIAILLLGFDTFCFNDVNRLRGNELLRMRHLEMMNYKVIHVKKSDFNILYENITAKIKHMKKLLQIGE